LLSFLLFDFVIMFLYAQREEDALKLGAKIRIFIGSAKKMDKKSIESQKNMAFCNVYMWVEGLFVIME
ncbi:MAG: hypothetical protein IKO08_05680, partial [Bacteroidales bacterium]|nr:hypothetical protein [Bacteroidales bacterium]